MKPKKRIGLLGSTGSVGMQTLDVVKNHREHFEIIYLTCYGQVEKMKEQIQHFSPKAVAVIDEEAAGALRQWTDIPVFAGVDALVEIVDSYPVDLLVTALVGSVGLLPTLKAIDHEIDIALANKETLVTAGHLVMRKAREKGVQILPVDSEHSALYQALGKEPTRAVEKVILTASGGPFRGKKKEDLLHVTKLEALKHPNWSMGQKISIDSATMMNKGLEVIEARWLFDLRPDQIEVTVHPESYVHSMVQFIDGSVIAQMSPPDMRGPIVYAMGAPERLETDLPRFDFARGLSMHFEAPDRETFPCLMLAEKALRIGGTMPTVLNRANELLVSAFLAGRIGFYDIPEKIAWVMDQHRVIEAPDIDTVLAVESETTLQIGDSL